jgi:mRNA interferase RelE/StbE
MTWTVNYSKRAIKALAKIDSNNRKRILNFIDNILPHLDNPKQQGKQLTGQFRGLWRYRVGDYRLICNIQDDEVIILVLDIGHRKKIYK